MCGDEDRDRLPLSGEGEETAPGDDGRDREETGKEGKGIVEGSGDTGALLIYPLLPLREMVLFPNMVMRVYVGRQKSLQAIEEAVSHGRELVVTAQKDATVDNPGPEDLYDVGCLVEIVQVVKLPDDIVKLMVEGKKRVKIHSFVDDGRLTKVLVSEVPELEPSGISVQALMRNVLSSFEQYVKISKKVPPEILMVANNVEDPGRLADIITANINLKVEEKQELLEAFDAEQRLELLSNFLAREIEILLIEKKIRGRVRKQMENIQKEYVLREQIKAIQKELGQKDELQEEVEEFRRRIEECGMPDEVKQKVLKELERFEKTPPTSAESGVLRNYLEIVTDLPWAVSSKDRLNIKLARRVLDRDHYGLEEPKERILEYLSVCKLKKSIKGPILCLLGPPGVGKTSIARAVAEAMGRKFVRVSLGGMHDEAEIRGHRKTYVGAMPGRIIQLIRRAGTNNPVFLLDEIDKTGKDFRGDPASALLEVLDPEQNHSFVDNYLGVPFDLSKVLFITTANIPHTIPEPLRDRMEIIRIPGYTEEEKLQIASRYLVPKQMDENGLKRRHIAFTEGALTEIIRHYTREAGVRELERKIGAVCRKVARQVVCCKRKKRRKVTRASIKHFLGVPKYTRTIVDWEDEVGVVVGLAWTEVGGVVMPIEAITMKGSGEVYITGNLGEVMKESVQAAVSYVRTNHTVFGLDKEFYKEVDIHVHAPEGAVPKEGPSAGITIATAVVSALTGIPVSKKVAMSGEITLLGNVYPVGGIKEKVLSAFRTGIRDVILSVRNEKDTEDIPREIRRRIRFHFVEHIEQALSIALKTEGKEVPWMRGGADRGELPPQPETAPAE